MKNVAKALIRDNQGNILVLYRSDTHPRLAHDLDLPGGEIEYGENMEVGTAREILEETGLDIPVNGEDLRYSWRAFWGQKYHVYEVTLETTPKVEISWEHESFDWVSEEEFVANEAKDEFIRHTQSWLRDEDGFTEDSDD